MTKLFTSLFFLLLHCSIFGQIADCFDHQYIVQLQPQENQEDYNSRAFDLKNQRCIHASSNIYLFEFDPSRSTQAIKALITDHPQVLAFQKNCKASLRNGNTDDPLSSDQWSLERIGVTRLWEVTQGTVTPMQDTIAVAILDSGFDVDQEDLIPNIWSNKKEIEDDNVDNDNNGFIDDILGLNLTSLTDDHASSFHGTAVAGIIGAKRDNELGIAGIAGDVKLMLFSEAILMDLVLEGLYYAYDQRKLYNESNGAEGTFVVATNYSLGFDQQKCINFPLFDIAYDLLGSVGILSVGASPNKNWNIDELGDVPASCTSDFLIAVTNTTEGDTKETDAAFGPMSIDLGAPGDNIIATFPNDDYKIFGGTSGATPHVAGAIALLYSSPCADFQELIKNNPAKAALEIKRFILEGVDPIQTLSTKTVSGGRLNVWNAFMRLAMEYGGSSSNFAIAKVFPNPSDGIFMLDLAVPRQGFYESELFDSAGRLIDRFEIPAFCLHEPYKLNLSGAGSGYYILRIQDGDEVILTPLIIL